VGPVDTEVEQQLQARLDNLSKINEKSTNINEQLAELKAVGDALMKQRAMTSGARYHGSARVRRSTSLRKT